jgi:uncharacterized protein (DUF58 family)
MGFKFRLPFKKRKNEEIKINFFGYLYIGFTLLIGFAAVNTGNNILYILLSFLLALMGISGLFSVYNLKRLKVNFIPPKEVWCCKENPFELIIRNQKRIPSFLIRVILPLKNTLSGIIPKVEKLYKGQIFIKPTRRGLLKINEIYLESDFPFGFFTRRLKVKTDLEVVIFPKPIEVKIPVLKQLHRGKLEKTTSTLKGKKLSGDTVEGIKEYSNEPRNLIYWKAFARTGQLYAKEVSSEERLREFTIDLETLPGKTLEEKIGQATYLVLKLHRMGFAVGLKYSNKVKIEPAYGGEHLKKLLTTLALL